MGWCSATRLFDTIVGQLLVDEIDKHGIIKVIVVALQDGDWDCECDTKYFRNPIVQDVYRELGIID